MGLSAGCRGPSDTVVQFVRLWQLHPLLVCPDDNAKELRSQTKTDWVYQLPLLPQKPEASSVSDV